jgi:hypothetical protein
VAKKKLSTEEALQPAHSKLGASSMHRWEACPGSVKLCEGIPNISSSYAEEGTEAHELGATWIQTGKKPAGDAEMLDAVEVYVKAVNEAVNDEASPLDELLIEHRFDLSAVHPGLFGTADCVIFKAEKRLLQVMDYKHGAGIAVEVEDNSQLKYYALGALLSLDVDAETVELVIVQPRCFHPDGPIRKWQLSAKELREFAKVIKKAAVETEKVNAPLHAGEHCRFCPAAATCPELSKKALALAKDEFSDVASYDPEKLARALHWLPTLEGWIKSVREFAFGEAQHGRCPPGFKLVAKRQNRRWRDEADAARALQMSFGLKPSQIFTKSLQTVAQIEKLFDAEPKKLLQAHIVSESSGATLVSVNDSRPAIKTDAASEFKDAPVEAAEIDLFS